MTQHTHDDKPHIHQSDGSTADPSKLVCKTCGDTYVYDTNLANAINLASNPHNDTPFTQDDADDVMEPLRQFERGSDTPLQPSEDIMDDIIDRADEHLVSGPSGMDSELRAKIMNSTWIPTPSGKRMKTALNREQLDTIMEHVEAYANKRVLEELYSLITPAYGDKNWAEPDTYVLNLRGQDILGRIKELKK